MRPLSSTATWSASWSASSRYWVVRRIVTPSVASSRMICHMVRRLRGSSPVVGSSRKITVGLPMSVIARSTRRRIPPEEVDSGLLAASVSSNRSSSSAIRRRPALRPRWRRSAISCRFSCPVSRLSTAENWPVTPIKERTASRSLATSCPPTRMAPPSARIKVDRMRTIVVFPAPLGPSSEKIVPSATVRSTPLSTMCSPKDLRTARALIADAFGLFITGFSLSAIRLVVGEFTGGAQRLTVRFPVLLHLRQSRRQEVGERGPLQQHRPPLKRFVGQQRQAFAREIALLAILGHIEPHRSRSGQVDTDAVHSLARGARAADHVEVVQGVDRAGDRASAGQQGLGQLRDALLSRVADRQVAEQPAHHRRHAVTARIETAGVVGEGDLGIGRHAHETTHKTEITQIRVGSVRLRGRRL